MEYVMRLSVLALPKCGIRLQAVIHPTGNRSAPTLLVAAFNKERGASFWNWKRARCRQPVITV